MISALFSLHCKWWSYVTDVLQCLLICFPEKHQLPISGNTTSAFVCPVWTSLFLFLLGCTYPIPSKETYITVGFQSPSKTLATQSFGTQTISLFFSDAELKNAIYQTRTDIFMLLTTLLRKIGPAVLIRITEAVAKHGNAFFGKTCYFLHRSYQCSFY